MIVKKRNRDNPNAKDMALWDSFMSIKALMFFYYFFWIIAYGTWQPPLLIGARKRWKQPEQPGLSAVTQEHPANDSYESSHLRRVGKPLQAGGFLLLSVQSHMY